MIFVWRHCPKLCITCTCSHFMLKCQIKCTWSENAREGWAGLGVHVVTVSAIQRLFCQCFNLAGTNSFQIFKIDNNRSIYVLRLSYQILYSFLEVWEGSYKQKCQTFGGGGGGLINTFHHILVNVEQPKQNAVWQWQNNTFIPWLHWNQWHITLKVGQKSSVWK